MRLLSVDARVTGRDRGALAALIESAGADIACVHHGPHLLRWRSISAAIGRRAGLVVVSGGRLAGANLLLSSLGVDSLSTHDVTLDGGSRVLPAGASSALLRHEGKEFVLAAATLIGNAGDRIAQAREVQHAIGAMSLSGAPVILCAQGVDRPGTGAWQTLAGDRTAVAGRVFTDKRITVGESQELDGYAATMLPPVTVELELPAPQQDP
jgi:hypothetical protein